MKPLNTVLAAACSFMILAVTPALAETSPYNHHGLSDKDMVRNFTAVFDRLDRAGEKRLSHRDLRRMEERRQYLDGTHMGISFGGENYRIAFGTGRPRHRGHGYIGPINAFSFHLFDLDDDGYIHRDELQRSIRIGFDYADDQGDGYLTALELADSDWYYSSHHHGDRSGHADYRHHRSPDRLYRDDYRGHYEDDYFLPFVAVSLAYIFHDHDHGHRYYSGRFHGGHKYRDRHRGSHKSRDRHRGDHGRRHRR